MSSYLTTLIPMFRGLSSIEGRSIAHDLSVAASEALASHGSEVILPEKYRGTQWQAVAGAHALSATMVSDPWQAYMLSSHTPESAFYAIESGIEGILATMPQEYRLDSLPENVIGTYADSLIAHLVSLINYAEYELIIIAPYWSVQGISAIRRSIKPGQRDGFAVTMVTAANPGEGDAAGAAEFKHIMKNEIGAVITHLEPAETDSGRIPRLHAKVVVADQKRAYVGSANFSQGGLSESIEMGVALSGTPALHIREWFSGIRKFLIEVEEH